MPVQDASPTGLGDRWTGRQLSPVFPKTRNSLWDKTSTGQPTFLHLGHYRKPRICVPEKILKLVQHQCENYRQGNHVLIGSLVIDADGEGVQVQVDRLDTRTNVPLTGANLAAANVLISFQVTNNAPNERTVPADAYAHALQLLQTRSCSKESLNLCEFMYLVGCGSFYSNAHSTVAHLDFDLVTFGTTFKSTPITPVPVAVTALSKNLATPRNLSSLQGTPKTGYLTMDSTRKVMLLLESDPKCCNLPVVGIWVSGVEFLHHPFVWAACLRYIHCTYLQDRACAPPEEFLLVLYRTLQTRPDFYQCATSSGDSGLQFELNTGQETVNMDKMLMSPGSGEFVEVELDLVQDGQKKEIFDAAKLQHRSSASTRDTGVSGQEDLEPRSAPLPHAEKVPVFRPMVPDVSVLWTDSFEHVGSDSPTSGLRNNGFALQKQQVLGFQAELLSKQAGPEPNFSRPCFTIPANSQQTRVLHTRPTPSNQYSPAGQQGAAVSSLQHSLPQDALPRHIRHNFHVSSDGISSAPAAVPQGYPTDTRNMSPRHVALPGSPHNFSPPTYQTSHPLPPRHMVSPSNMKYNDSVAQISSHERKHLATPLPAHANSHSLPFPDTSNNSRNVHDQNSHNSNCYNSQNPITKVSLLNSQSNNMTSATKGGQQSGILSSEAHTQVHINEHSDHLNSQVHAGNASYQPSSCNGVQHYKGALNTINEECLLSPFSQPSLQQQEQHSTRMFEINDRGKSSEANVSSLRSSINSSIRPSAEDSGLDATSDRLSISQHGSDSSHPAPAKASACACASPSCAQQNRPESIKWEQVPPEVMTVLMQQSAQLQLLQQQVQMLQSEIARTNRPVQPDLVKGDTRHHQKTSVAVNTSFVNDPIAGSQNLYDSKSTQVTPVRHVSRQPDLISPATSYTPKSARLPVEGSQSQMYASHNITAAASSAAVQMLRHSQQGSSSCAQKDIRQLEFDKDITIIPEFEHAMDLSEPECAAFNDRSQLDWSPSSASDYDRQAQESYSTVGGDATDNQQFLSQVMKHINMFLTNGESQTEESYTLPALPVAETTPRVSPSKLDNLAGPSVVPEAGCMTMTSGFGTDPSQTGEMNALAMKYLSDEQLATVAQLRQTAPSRSHSSAYSAKILEQVMGGCASSMAGSTSASDLSQFGISPCDMTMGTWNYLQRHGLLGNNRSTVGISMLEHDLKLRTDFSILTNGSAAGNINLSPATTLDEAQFLRLHADPEVSSDHGLSPSRLKAPRRANNENWLPLQAGHVGDVNDMRTPPMLAAPDNSANNGAQEYANRGQHILQGSDRRRNVLQEVRPQVFVNVKTGSNISPLIKACPVEEDEEEEENHSLDIEKLRQLPKLL